MTLTVEGLLNSLSQKIFGKMQVEEMEVEVLMTGHQNNFAKLT